MSKTFHLKVAGLERELKVCKLNDKLSIAAFIIFGDVEMTVCGARELLKKCPEFDCILTAEAKSIPLAYEMSKQSGKPYYIARKGKKLYMDDPVVVSDKSITTASQQVLVMDRSELDEMNDKRILIVDDVISTGGSLRAMEALAAECTGTIVGKSAILAEGDAALRTDIIFLGTIPLISND